MGKILCLHGKGCSGAIFEAQLSAFRRRLGIEYEYVFVDAEIGDDPAPGIDKVAPPPYLRFYDSPSLRAMQQAHELVLDVIEEEGPFDGVIGFSQGAALAASLLLHRVLTRSTEPPLFNFAIFFSGFLPCSPDVHLYEKEIDQFLAEEPPEGVDEAEQEKLSGYVGLMVEYMNELLASTRSANIQVGDVYEGFAENMKNDQSYRPYHPRLLPERIWIPTAHIQGVADPFIFQARNLYELCHKNTRKLVEHPGGHDVPRDMAGMQAAAKVAREVIEQGKLVASGVLHAPARAAL